MNDLIRRDQAAFFVKLLTSRKKKNNKKKGRQQSVAFQFSFILDLIGIGVSVIRSLSIKLEPLSCGKVSYERKPSSTAKQSNDFCWI